MPDDNKPIAPEESSTQSVSGDAETPQVNEMEALLTKVAEMEASASTYKDQLLRKAAEFENYRKRVESENATLMRLTNEDLIQKLLPVIDDFERMIKANSSADPKAGQRDDAFMKGVELIYSKFRKIMESQGVKEFEALGKPFDPELHDALLQMPKEGVPPHTVIEEVEKGYMLHEKVIRHARVIVSAEGS